MSSWSKRKYVKLPQISDAERYAWLREHRATVHVQENISGETGTTGDWTYQVFDPYIGYSSGSFGTMDEAVDHAIRYHINLSRNLPGAG